MWSCVRIAGHEWGRRESTEGPVGFEGRVDTEIEAAGQKLVDDGSGPFGFYVKPSAKLFHVEATWEDSDASLDLQLRGPETGEDDWEYTVPGGEFGDPERPLAITIWRDEVSSWQGDWNVTMTADDVAVDLDYRIVVTIFNWEPVLPEDYSAL